MDTKKTFQLIDGEFSGDQARQIIGAMVRHKIDYHNREQFGDEIRLGNAKDCSASRLEKLRKLEKELIDLFSDSQANNKKLQIRGHDRDCRSGLKSVIYFF